MMFKLMVRRAAVCLAIDSQTKEQRVFPQIKAEINFQRHTFINSDKKKGPFLYPFKKIRNKELSTDRLILINIKTY